MAPSPTHVTWCYDLHSFCPEGEAVGDYLFKDFTQTTKQGYGSVSIRIRVIILAALSNDDCNCFSPCGWEVAKTETSVEDVANDHLDGG